MPGDVYNLSGEKVDELALKDEIFDRVIPYSAPGHRALLTNQRARTSRLWIVRGREEKAFRQKGPVRPGRDPEF
jgi:hypothetical protein